ncbi:DUF2182 domain-containing protein [Microbaculum marinum]|uniref:DUF2182 domain-containing protein n=1 Tax=Microbaculum marinum TaxID=1764581 RepID=A0AAW9RSD0_9HYPH
MTADSGNLRHLTGPAAALAAASANPRRIAWIVLASMVVVAWLYLAVLSTAAGLGGTFGALGPGMSVLDRLLSLSDAGSAAFAILASNGWLATLIAVCATSPADWSAGDAALHASMWLTMGVAMMLPTAAPMLRTYAEIADTAAAKGRRIVSPLVLAAGYLTVWSAFALAATLLEWTFGVTGALSGNGAMLTGGLAVAVLLVAGMYQFTRQKAACLVKCAHPFPFLFANWTEHVRGVYAIGIRQGLYCLACCWALMLVMFAVGVMNIVWIALLAAVMTAEKLIGRRWFSHLVGVVLLVWAAVVALGLPGGIV